MDETTADQQPRDENESPGAGRPEDTARTEPTDSPRPATTRRLTRRTDQKVLGGVASGLAAYFTIDPVISRLAFVAFGFLTGPLAVLLYAIAWVVIPPDTGKHTGLHRGNGIPTWVWVVLVGLVAILSLPLLEILGLLGPDFGVGFEPGFDVGFGPGLFWALLLLGLGVLLFRRSERAEPPSAASSTALPANVSTGSTSVAQPHRQPSVLGRLAVAAGLVVVGGAALLDNLDVFELNGRRLFALLLLVIGMALLIGAWWGTARWLIVIGALLVAALFSISVVETFGVPIGRPFGDRTWRPTSRAQVAKPFELGIGDLTLDLTQMPLSTDVTRVAADVGMGDVEVIVPADADVTVNSRVGLGEVDVFGYRQGGAGITVNDYASERDGSGRLVLDIEDGLGDVTVRRAAITSTEGV
jgi:phage shock protein PspC (stress-responsive transcriptional regulator)